MSYSTVLHEPATNRVDYTSSHIQYYVHGGQHGKNSLIGLNFQTECSLLAFLCQLRRNTSKTPLFIVDSVASAERLLQRLVRDKTKVEKKKNGKGISSRVRVVIDNLARWSDYANYVSALQEAGVAYIFSIDDSCEANYMADKIAIVDEQGFIESEFLNPDF